MTPLFKKLNLGKVTSILVLSAPESFEGELSQLHGVAVQRKATAKQKVPFVIGFAATQKELDRLSSTIAKATEGDSIVWLAYPKSSSKKYKCDFNRDTGWTVLGEAGFEPVRQVAIDADWSALRFRRAEHIKSLTRSNALAISAGGKSRTKNTGGTNSHDEKIAALTFAAVYPHYVTKVERKGRTQEELHQVIRWLTGFNDKALQKHIDDKSTFEQFFKKAKINPKAHLITGVICGYRVEEIENPLTQQARYLDKLVDELAQGRKMEKILRVG